ncbi:putative pheromone receptor protein [Eutypa lata UCREL1]|uniref:Putative pheromone receptor protein n=1 Tax=Eutypa lata (strain UCR-EL1) TaxID=1287681 RepID=M7SG63_EUTLA|nr:putative pheromone receptor protein [Eutypa lata UCREL1]
MAATATATSIDPAVLPLNPKLLTNLIARVSLAILGTLLCWVPLRVLGRNGEFAATVLIATVCALNAITVINSLTWRSDDWTQWPSGRGLCDLEVYLLVPLDTMYAAAVFAVVRRLAGQVRLSSGSSSSGQQLPPAHSHASLGAATVVVFTYFDLAQRFVVGTLVGCSAVYDNSLPKLLVFDVPPAAFAIASVPYAYLTYTRYRKISNQTTAILGPANSPATVRAHRTRRRLYLMCVAILTVYLPLQLFLAAMGIRDTVMTTTTKMAADTTGGGAESAAEAQPLQTYSFGRIHSEIAGSSPEHRYAWSAILFIPSWLVPFYVMNQPYVAVLTAGVVFAFFGLGDEAKEMYKVHRRRDQYDISDDNLDIDAAMPSKPGDSSRREQ